MLSVLIPARNEKYLLQTIQSTLAAAKGEIEIIAVLDGYWPEPVITDDPRVTLIHHTEPVGQRPAINEAARLAKGKYILKTDGHSMFDAGFDVKLAADCEYDWTVIPKMINLDAEKWEPKWRKHTEFMWINGPDAPDEKGAQFRRFRAYYWDGPTKRAFPMEYAAYKKNPYREGDICDVMTSQGSCFFMHKARFWELGGMDEAHGHWGQMGVEVALKAWLSGGSLKVNKKTWFSHLFRKKFPWKANGNKQERARKYSQRFWKSGAWEKQVRPLEWMAEKFGPVPNWNGKAYPVKVKPRLSIIKPELQTDPGVALLGVLTGSHNINTVETEKAVQISIIIPARNEKHLQKTIDELAKTMALNYEVLVGLDNYTPDPPLKQGHEYANVTVYSSPQRVGTRVLLNKLVSMAKGKYLLRLDPHCKIAKGMDRDLLSVHKPGYTIVPRWYLLNADKWERKGKPCDYRYLTHPEAENGGLRSLRWDKCNEQFKDKAVDEVMTCSGSIWLMEKSQYLAWDGLDEKHGQIGQEGVEIACKTWLSGGKMLVNKDTWYAHWNRNRSPYAIGRKQRQSSIAYSLDLWLNNKWPGQKREFDWLIKHFSDRRGIPPGWTLKDIDTMPKTWKSAYQYKSRTYKTDELYDNFEKYAVSYKKNPAYSKSVHRFQKAFRPFIDDILAGDPYIEQFMRATDKPDPSPTIDKPYIRAILEIPYYKYLVGHLNEARVLPDGTPDRGGLKRVLNNMRDSIKLCRSIRKGGMYAPLDMWDDGKGNRVLQRGQRRVVIAKKLGIRKLVARVFKSHEVYLGVIDKFDERSGGPVEKAAQDQFAKHGRKATDKWYTHNYTHLYDRALATLVKTRRRSSNPVKILEIGVKDGASLRIWKEVFPAAQVFGLDIKDVSDSMFLKDWDGAKLLIGSQADAEFLKREVIPNGPFDMIVDDGSHYPKDMDVTLDTLWPALANKGVYVLEDFWHSVHHSSDRPLIMARVKKMMDDVYSSKDVLSVECNVNICFIRKT